MLLRSALISLILVACASGSPTPTSPERSSRTESQEEVLSQPVEPSDRRSNEPAPAAAEGPVVPALLEKLRRARDEVCACANVACLDHIEAELEATVTKEEVASIDTEEKFQEMMEIAEDANECSVRIRAEPLPD